VTEQALAGAVIVGTLQVYNPPPVFDALVDINPPQSQLLIQKDIFVRSVNEPASIASIDQTFSQIPEPGTIALVSVSLLGLSALARRRR
jgi:hypothetical protein